MLADRIICSSNNRSASSSGRASGRRSSSTPVPSAEERRRVRSFIAGLVGLVVCIVGWWRRVWRYAREEIRRKRTSSHTIRIILARVEGGKHATLSAGDGSIMSLIAQVIGYRGASKSSAVASACKAVRELLDVNPALEKAGDWDLILAALVAAKANPPKGAGVWVRPANWKVCDSRSSGKIGGTLATALSDLGYHPASWPALRSVRKNLGCAKDQDPSPPIFAWEVGGPGVGGRSTWEKAALAWTTFLCTSGARPGTMAGARLRNVARIDGECVWMTFPRCMEGGSDSEEPELFQFKDDRRTAMRAPGRTRGLILDNWRIAKYLIPWISFLRFMKFRDQDHLFPAIVDARRSKDKESPVFEGSRLIRGRSWNSREKIAGMDFVLGTRRATRTANGFRHGQTVEFGALGVRPEVRFRCQLRSLKPILGSEASYDRVLEDAARAASRALGSRKIIQGTVGLSTIALSPSQGRLDDWVSCQAVPLSSPISAYTCQECGTDVDEDDPEGALCDADGCEWGLCVSCHPDLTAPLLCPVHTVDSS